MTNSRDAVNLEIVNRILSDDDGISEEERRDYLDVFNHTVDIVLNGSLNVSRNAELNMCNLSTMSDAYEEVHGYLAVTVCVLGTVFNLVNIIVLTHKDMRTNPINLLLTGIAVADMLVMLEYVPFAAHMYLLKERPLQQEYSYSWAMFLLFHANITHVLHGMSIWYTLVLAVWRLIMIRHHDRALTLCTRQRCYVMILLGCVVPFLLTIPNVLAHDVEQTVKFSKGENHTIYRINFRKEYDLKLYNLNVWFYSLLKLVPCILLSIITSLLIRALVQFSGVRVAGGNIQDQEIETREALVSTNVSLKRKMRTDRTTRLLIAILCLFLISEFPQGIMGILSGYLGMEFFEFCYTPLGEMMDMLTLFNCMINFILYCTMSRQFRLTFRKIFKIRTGGTSSWCNLMRGCSQDDKSTPMENIFIEKYVMVPVPSNNNKITVPTIVRPEQHTI